MKQFKRVMVYVLVHVECFEHIKSLFTKQPLGNPFIKSYAYQMCCTNHGMHIND